MDDNSRLEAFALAASRHLNERGARTRLAKAIDVKPQTLSGWINGSRMPPVEKVSEIEEHLALPPGTLTVHLGYLPLAAKDVTITSTEEAIIADQRFDGSQKRLLFQMIDQLLAAQERREQQQE